MNNVMIPWIICLVGLLVVLIYALVIALLKVIKQITETNKQLLIVVAGKEEKPDSALKALVASNRPPRKNLAGIAGPKKKDTKTENTNFTMKIGVKDGN